MKFKNSETSAYKGFPIYAGATFVLPDKVVSALQHIASIDFVVEAIKSESRLMLGFKI